MRCYIGIGKSALYSVLFAASSCLAETNLAELESKHEQSIASEAGKAFEMKAVQTFWGDAVFMQKCAPPDTRSPGPLVIYFEVRRDGSLGQLVISPQNEVARCISEAVAGRTFPIPPHDWMGKISLKFTN